MINLVSTTQTTGGTGFAPSNPPDQVIQAIPQLAEAANDGSETSQRGQDFLGKNGTTPVDTQDDMLSLDLSTSEDAQTEAPQLIVFSANMVTGPTPTFQVSLMDIGSELRNEIAMAQAKQTHIPDAAPMTDASSEMSSAISSAELSTPTERRDAQISTSSSSNIEIDNIEMPTPMVQSLAVAAQDPEAMYAGSAALQVRPYEGLDISV